jgi:hypothetical protein
MNQTIIPVQSLYLSAIAAWANSRQMTVAIEELTTTNGRLYLLRSDTTLAELLIEYVINNGSWNFRALRATDGASEHWTGNMVDGIDRALQGIARFADANRLAAPAGTKPKGRQAGTSSAFTTP